MTTARQFKRRKQVATKKAAFKTAKQMYQEYARKEFREGRAPLSFRKWIAEQIAEQRRKAGQDGQSQAT